MIDASEINNIDYTAGMTLIQLGSELDKHGVGIGAVALPTGVRHQIERYKALRVSSAHREIFATVDAAIDVLRDLSPSGFEPSSGVKPE